MSIQFYLLLAALLFSVGLASVLIRRNPLMTLLGAELMLNSANLGLVAAAHHHGNLDGQVGALFVMVIAAAEVVVGLAIIVAIFRSQDAILVDDQKSLKG